MGVGDPSTASHWKDWPNAAGFDVREEVRTPVSLPISGTIPAYAAGVLYRNGLGPRDVHADKDGRRVYRVSHWFDNLSQVHRFQIHPPTAANPSVTVTHNSRLTCDKAVERIKREARRSEFTFGPDRDPCQTIFQKAQCFFRPQPKDSPSSLGIGVDLSANFPGLDRNAKRSEKGVDSSKLTTLFNKSDHDIVQSLDPRTLEPLGIAEQKVLHPALKGPISGAHAATDPETGDVFNYNLDVGKPPTGGIYRIFTVSARTGKTDILATFSHRPAYIHSMFLTEHFAVLCVWNAFYTGFGAQLLWKRNLVEAMEQYDRSKPATWFVVDRTAARRGVVATFETDAFFCFHSINTFEEATSDKGDTVDLVADLIAYDGLDTINRFYIDNLLSDSPAAQSFATDASTRGIYRRYRLPGVPLSKPNKVSSLKAVKGELLFSGPQGYAPELPSINPTRRTRDYRFAYGTIDTATRSTFVDGLVKWDVRNRTYTTWCVHGQTPSEPIFVADPARSDREDGGCLLSVVLDGTEGKSYLLVLDAETMQEMGRASVDGVVGFGFHGIHVPQEMVDE